MKILFRLLLVAAAVVLTYLCVESIMRPIRFDDEKAVRDRAVINRLIDIRKAQVEFRNTYGHYTADLDSLVTFVKTGTMNVVMKEGILTDQALADGMTEAKALAIIRKGNQKEIEENNLQNFRRDTLKMALLDTIYPKGFIVDSLPYVPGTQTKFEMAVAQQTTPSGIVIRLFEAKTPFDVYLGGMDRQSIVNLNDRAKKMDKYPGLQVGSVVEANNNAGNWE